MSSVNGTTPPGTAEKSLGDIVSEVSEKASLLVREEIELAKAEVSEKLSKLVKGAVVGMAAGIFFVTGLLFLLHGAAWGIWRIVGGSDYWFGFVVVAGVLFLLGVFAGALAYRFVRKSAPPTPVMAIDEAKRIRETVAPSGGTT